MNRYSLIRRKLKREMVLLKGEGCKWKRCKFCDYHNDTDSDPFSTNKVVLERVTGEFGTLDVINSGSATELDAKTISLLQRVVVEKGIKTLWFEAHYIYRHKLEEFAQKFPGVEVKFRCGVESFDPKMRALWDKGIPESVLPEDIAKYFKGVCLLCCTEGDNPLRVVRDIEIALKHFEYLSLNLFCNNTTSVKRDDALYNWAVTELYPKIKDNPKIEILIENTDLGIG